MSKIYLPHADQFDVMNGNLMRIVATLGADIDISTWEGIQKAVRVGVAPNLIPVGTQMKVTHSVYGEMVFDVVAHDLYKSRYDEKAHTKTLMCHDLIKSMHYDRIEAFYYRGYSVAEKDNVVIKSVNEISKGDRLTLIMRDGTAVTEVVEIKGEQNI